MTQPTNQWQAAAATITRPKMDMAKALALLGFSSSRTLDPSGGHDPKHELSNALCRQMAIIERKKSRMPSSKLNSEVVQAKIRDEVRILHEAYQFLCRKYTSLGKAEEEEEDTGISPLAMLDQASSGAYQFGSPDDDNEDSKPVDDNQAEVAVAE